VISQQLRNKILAVLIIGLSILLIGWWADSIILRYNATLYIALSAIATIYVVLLIKNIQSLTAYRAALYGSLLGYGIGLLSNFILEFSNVEYFADNFLDGIKEIPFQVLVAFLIFPIILGAWLQGLFFALAVQLFHRNDNPQDY